TTREKVQGIGARAASLPDVGSKSLVPLKRTALRPPSRLQAIYRITIEGERDAAAAFAQDAHPEGRSAHGGTFELVVHPVRDTRHPGAARPGPEFLSSSYYLDGDNPHLKELARQAAGLETDPWRTALAIERWVHHALRPDNGAPLVPASQVARTRRGDCRHYA